MKYLRITAVLLGCLMATRVFPQTSNAWVELAPEGEYFRISMPHQPSEQSFTGLNTNLGFVDLNGKVYETSSDGTIYKLWVLTNLGNADHQRQEPDLYLDGSAELIWEGLLKTAREKLPDEQRKRAAMSYAGELSGKTTRGREYAISLGETTGAIQFYIAESRVYILLVAHSAVTLSDASRFFESFKLGENLPGKLAIPAAQICTGIRGPTNPTEDQPTLRSSEVTERARLLEKPEPTYTESARKFSVTGTVVLRAVFSKEGEVTDIYIIRRLPHGLTEKALNAARAIRFKPATKDGHPVSMWMQLEYNFNLY